MKKLVLSTAAMLLGLGAVGALSGKHAIEANAGEGVSGTISVDLTGESWASNEAGQKISVYFWDNDSNSGWGTLEFAAQYEYVVFVDYDLEFTPTMMKAVRYNPYINNGESQNEFWETDPWCSGEGHAWAKWNEGENLGFAENGNIVVAGTGYSYVGTVSFFYKGSDTSWDYQDRGLPSVRLNSKNHVEYYTTVTVYQWSEFYVKMFSTGYGHSSATYSSMLASGAWIGKADEWPQIGTDYWLQPSQYIGEESLSIIVSFDRNAGKILVTRKLDDALTSYNDDGYTKKTEFTFNEEAIEELAEHFHAGATTLKRATYYNAEETALLMGDYDGGFEHINSGYINTSETVCAHYSYSGTGDYFDATGRTDWDHSQTVGAYYPTLTALAGIINLKEWNATSTGYTFFTEDFDNAVLDKFQFFAAPMLKVGDYLSWAGVAVDQGDGYLSIKMLVSSSDSGKTDVAYGDYFVISEAKVYSGL